MWYYETMDKQTMIDRVAETGEDRLLLARLYDKLTAAERRCVPGYTAFLAPREQILLRRLLPELPICFFGGHPEAERAVACYLPDYLEPDWLSGPERPVAAVRATFYEKDNLTHRDFLGSLMGCGIKRETVGDIYVAAGSCDFLVTREILPYVLDQLTSAGRTHLTLRELPLQEVSGPCYTLKTLRDTVASLRLDALVGAGFSMARGKAAELIAAGKVSLDGMPCLKPDKLAEEGAKISARGYGKLVLSQINGRTKKDRISIVLEKYQ